MTDLFQFRIVLAGSNPSIWRLVEMPVDTSLSELHRIVQDVMPWHNAHLHRFERHDERWEMPEYLDERRPNHHSLAGVDVGDVLGSEGRRDELVEHKRRWLADDFDPDTTGLNFQSASPMKRPNSEDNDSVAFETDLDSAFAETANVDLDEVRWAIRELLRSSDGLSPGAHEVFDGLPGNSSQELLLRVARNEELRNAGSMAPVYALDSLVEMGAWEILNDLAEIVAEIPDPDDPLCGVALDGLVAGGERAVEPLLDVVASTNNRDIRLNVLAALVEIGVDDDRVFETLVDALELLEPGTPEPAWLLGRYEDPRGIDPLREKLDALVDPVLEKHGEKSPKALQLVYSELDDVLRVAEYVERAIERLDGEPAAPEKLDRLRDLAAKGAPKRSDRFGVKPPKGNTVVTEETPGRNDPCPCGSGRKYKQCCLRRA